MRTTSITALALAGLVSTVQAQTVCPDGSTPGKANGNSVCCNGNLNVNVNNGNTAINCIIGCDTTITYASCFPFCTDGNNGPGTSTSGVCTTVPITASDYTEIVYGTDAATATEATATNTAASGATATGGAETTTSRRVATGTRGTDGVASTTSVAGTTITTNPSSTSSAGTTVSSGGSESSGSVSSTSTNSAAGYRVTQAPVFAVAGAIAGLALF
ncbi:hypothetical protein BX600DRAFT_523178 [Xylariales sp. PMI_506]|nr:hypothetical protein BX600DRAFT_523178 [Xylariales sp. PMI_506]